MKKNIFLFAIFLSATSFVLSAEDDPQRLSELFPDNFTQDELDNLKDGKPVFRGNIRYSLTKENAQRLWANYPYYIQMFTKGGFPNRVKKSSKNPSVLDNIATQNYYVKGTYDYSNSSSSSSYSPNDNEVFFVDAEKILDTNAPLLVRTDHSGSTLDSRGTTSLISIKEMGPLFVDGGEVDGINKEGNGYDQRLRVTLAKYFLVLHQEVDEYFNGDETIIIQNALTQLRSYIRAKTGDDIPLDDPSCNEMSRDEFAERVMSKEKFYQIVDILKQELYEKYKINEENIPSLEFYTTNFLNKLPETFQGDRLERVIIGLNTRTLPLVERLDLGDPSLIKGNLE